MEEGQRAGEVGQKKQSRQIKAMGRLKIMPTKND